MEFIPVALACGHVLQEQAWFEIPAEGSGDPALVECPEGCGMVEFVLPPDIQNRPRGPFIEIDLGELEAGDSVDISFD